MRAFLKNLPLLTGVLACLSSCDYFCDCEEETTPCAFTYDRLIYTQGVDADPAPQFEGTEMDPEGTFSAYTDNSEGELVIDSLSGIIDVDASDVGEYTVVFTLDDGETTCETQVAIEVGEPEVMECNFSYGTDVVSPGEKNLLRPVFDDETTINGTFTVTPSGLDISTDEGVISVNTSASGQRYRITYTSADKQTHCETELLISGIDYLDQIVDLDDDLPDVVFPILDADPEYEEQIPGFYDVDGSAQAQGLSIDQETGEINLSETLDQVDNLRRNNELPLIAEGEPLRFTFSYRLNRNQEQPFPLVNTVSIVIYWFENEIPEEIQELLRQKSKYPITNGREMSPPSMLIAKGSR